MNRKVFLARILSIVLMAFIIVSMVINPVLAADDKSTDSAPASLSTTQFNGKGVAGGAQTSVTNIVGAIITLAQVIGTGVAIIMLIVLAIKYISAAPSEKAEIKKTVIIYVVGAIVLFAASGILEIIKQFAVNNVK